MGYYLAVDIGASGGRHILGTVENGLIKTEEIYRFDNGPVRAKTTGKSRGGQNSAELVWDTDRLFGEILEGMRRCRAKGIVPDSIGVDTWGVDFVLTDANGKRIGNAVCYRDARTDGMDAQVEAIIESGELYRRTGIQKQPFNTIFQLAALKRYQPEQIEEAEHFLMLPDYFHYLLSGVMVNEYTNASTTQLFNHETKDWDKKITDLLGLPGKLFESPVMPGTVLGNLRPEIAKQAGFDCRVVVPATHDTASAVMAVPGCAFHAEDTLYLSSGTWSLMGTELNNPCITEAARLRNYTNEGGYGQRYRFLKNITGLWMIQEVRREHSEQAKACKIKTVTGRETDSRKAETLQESFASICEKAKECDIDSLIDVNDRRFLAPVSMTEEVRKACKESGQRVPRGLYETAHVIYRSLAQSYAQTVTEIENITGKKFGAINIVGGGSNADYLNRLTADAAGLPVYAGPSEATALGNLAAQMIAAGEFSNLDEARERIAVSFPIKKYLSGKKKTWEQPKIKETEK